MGFGISDLYSILPVGTKWRELWLPELINNHATLPSAIAGGHPLTLTGARKGTTADGVYFFRNNSVINAGAIHNASAKLWLSLRFRISTGHVAGDPHRYLFSKRIGAADYLNLWLDGGDGRLYWRLEAGGIPQFNIPAWDGGGVISTWEPGRWYHVLASLGQQTIGGAASDGARLIIDGGTVRTDANMSACPNGGSFLFGQLIVGGGVGPGGTISDIFVGTDDLTATEEIDLYKGIPPADVVNEWLLDEGRGLVAIDRGSGGNNGTLDTSCTWAFGQVQQPVLSLDGINDHGQSSVGVDISGDLTVVWVGKMKSTYDGLLASHDFIDLHIAATGDYLTLYYASADFIRFICGVVDVQYVYRPTIDEYGIFLGTVNGVSGVMTLFHNGILVGSNTDTPSRVGAAIAYIGKYHAPGHYDVSKPLLIGLISGAFTEKQALTFSKLLRDLFNLPIVI